MNQPRTSLAPLRAKAPPTPTQLLIEERRCTTRVALPRQDCADTVRSRTIDLVEPDRLFASLGERFANWSDDVPKEKRSE